MRLIGGDDGEHRLGAGDRLGRGRCADDVRPPRSRPASPPAPAGIGRVGLDVVNANARREAGVGAPAVEKGARRLAETDEGDGAWAIVDSVMPSFGTPGLAPMCPGQPARERGHSQARWISLLQGGTRLRAARLGASRPAGRAAEPLPEPGCAQSRHQIVGGHAGREVNVTAGVEERLGDLGTLARSFSCRR